MIHATHIEAPNSKFEVSFHRPGYFNEYWHPPGQRTVTVLAETGEGALKVAQYHWHNGSNFQLVTKSMQRVIIVSYENFTPESTNKNPETGVVELVMDPPMALSEVLSHVRDFNQLEISENKGFWATFRPVTALPKIGDTITLTNQN